MDIAKIIREETIGFIKESEEYFTQTLPDNVKKHSNRYVGRGVIWYGDPDQMIVLHKDNIHGMWGNEYDSQKLQYVEDLIRHSEEYVELECSYAIGGLIDLTDIIEHQQAEYQDRFTIDYDGFDRPYSTDDEELDKYVVVEELDEYLDWLMWDEIGLYELLSKNKFFLVNGKSLDSLKKEIEQLKITNMEEGDINFTERDMEFLKEFIKIEKQLKTAVDDEYGDIGNFDVQLRDGHHRVMGAIAAGEQHVCVNLAKEQLGQFDQYINRVR